MSVNNRLHAHKQNQCLETYNKKFTIGNSL